MPPDFGEFAFPGWQEKFPHGFAGRGKSGEGASKSHPPFNLHTIRPCPTASVYSPSLDSQYCHHRDFWMSFEYILSNRPTGCLLPPRYRMPPWSGKWHTEPHGGSQGADVLFQFPIPRPGIRSMRLSHLPPSHELEGHFLLFSIREIFQDFLLG